MPTPWNPFDWASEHWGQMLGVAAVSTFLYRLYIGVRKIVGLGEAILSARSDLELLKTNHIPHLQVEVEKVNENLVGLREDIRDGLDRLSDNINVVLMRMP